MLSALAEKWKGRGHLNDKDFDRLNTDFLPPALAIQDRPPHPASRIIFKTLVSVFTIAVIWATFGHVDIIVSAQGRLIPQTRVKVVQPMELGKVTKLHAREGMYVDEGQVLVELDVAQIDAEIKRLEEQILDYNQRSNGLSLLITSLVDESIHDVSFNSQPKEYIPWLDSLREDYLKQEELLKKRYQAQNHNISSSKSLLKKYSRTLPIIDEKANSLSELLKTGSVSRIEYLESEQTRITLQQDIEIETRRLAAMMSELQGIETEYAAHSAATTKQWQQQKLDFDKESTRLVQELNKQKDRKKKSTLISPVEGVVKNLAISTIGAVVNPADELMTIVPSGDSLQLEAYIENKDIGFVHEGQQAEVKINTFNFTKYGVIGGTVIHISDDSIENENVGFVFPIRIELDSDVIKFDGRRLKIQPGMEGSAEIKTGKRRLIEFFISPLIRHKAESLNER